MIVTLAECVQDINNATQIKVGSEELKVDANSVLYEIESVALHPDFTESQDYNIAILYTSEDIDFNENTMPICVPQISVDDEDELEDYIVTVSAWTSSGLQTQDLVIEHNSYCQRFDLPAMESYHLCAGEDNFGEKGTPMVMTKRGNNAQSRFYQLIGLKINGNVEGEQNIGWFIRLNDPKVLEFVLNAIQN